MITKLGVKARPRTLQRGRPLIRMLIYVLASLAIGIAIGAGVGTLQIEDAKEPAEYGKPG